MGSGVLCRVTCLAAADTQLVTVIHSETHKESDELLMAHIAARSRMSVPDQ